jgi:hypothetical protein
MLYATSTNSKDKRSYSLVGNEISVSSWISITDITEFLEVSILDSKLRMTLSLNTAPSCHPRRSKRRDPGFLSKEEKQENLMGVRHFFL